MNLLDLLPASDGSSSEETPLSENSAAESTAEEHDVVCSRKGCRRQAAFALLWNNPRLHTPERRKSWACCPEHLEYLSGFLADRGFLKDVRPL